MSTKTKHKRGNEKDGHIFLRYFITTIPLGIMAALIFIWALNIGVKEKNDWLELAKKSERPVKMVSPTRGNIYSDDDRLMATNAPQYYMYIDFKADGFVRDSFLHARRNSVDSLAWYLSKKLKNRTPAGYKSYLMNGYKTKNRQYPVYEGRVSYTDLKEIRTYPFLRFNRNKSGFYTKEMMNRQKPFGMLASRTIGDIFNEVGDAGVTQGRMGLEMQYDSLLRGIPGQSMGRRIGGRWADVVIKDPVDGMDIRSTININIQDMVEKALTDKLKALDADAGTAVVMEVKTGEIKAITNMERKNGAYVEALNHAVADEIEPGSTFKVASMMVALDDGVAAPQTPVDVGDGIFMYANRRMTDHNSNHGGYGAITAEKAIWYSSNIGVAKIILNGYGNNPRKFVEGLRRVGMDADLRIEIPGAGRPKLRWPDDRYWSKTSLPWMTFGYEVRIPPIQTLTFFNAIANGGKMVRPMFVKDIMKNGRTVKHFDSETIIPHICSDKTLKMIQDMLYNVVNYKHPTASGLDGTGKPARSEVVTIAGKTGTAQIASGGVYRTAGHNVSFCGYFPYEKPLYTCIVVITHPRSGIVSGGAMCGTVVKEIAEKILAQSKIIDVDDAPVEQSKVAHPAMKNGDYKAFRNVTDELDITVVAKDKIKSQYVYAAREEKGVGARELSTPDGLVPNVVGMGVKDAVYALEKCGLRTSVNGYGRVVSQTIAGGSKAVPGQTVILQAKN